MSSLNSSTRQVRKRAFGDRPTPRELHVTGVDIELLEAAYAIVHRELNFFPGDVFTTIEKSFREYCPRGSVSLSAEWVADFAQAEAFNQVVMVAHDNVQNAEDSLVWANPPAPLGIPPFYFAEVRVYLNKSGDWLVWTNRPNSRFVICKSPRSAVETAYSMLRPGEYFSLIESLSLEIGSMLARAHGSHVDERERRLTCSRENQAKLKFLTGYPF